ncbi:hexuronate transporter [Bryobacterales bacterium F-183]|nr:hexuronate transporter [Bryobacterales bacterium F-183]
MELSERTLAKYRYWILTLIFSVAVVNYVDRQAFSVASSAILKEFHMPAAQFGRVVSMFLLAYAVAQPLAGRLLDRVGSVRGFAWAVLWWSAACAMHAVAGGVWSFGIYRFLLGFGEGALIPACIKTISEWMPKNDRAFGIGIMNAGISIGGMIATPLIAELTLRFGWRMMFVVTGALGLIWLAAWLWFMGGKQPVNTAAEPAPAPGTRHAAAPSWRDMLRRREIVGLVLSRVISDPAWYFYLFWLPPYLAQVRGFDLRKLSIFGWIPFATSLVGALLSGWIAQRLLQSGWSIDRTRKGILLFAAVLMPAGILVGYADDVYVCLALICLVTFLIQVWATSLFAIPADLFPPSQVGSVVGFCAATGSLSAMLFQLVVGEVVDRFSYTPIFTTVALMHPLALVCIHRFIRRIDRLPAA